MKRLLIASICALLICPQLNQAGVYYHELEAFKANPTYHEMFDENISLDLQMIHRDIQNYKELSWGQRLLRSAFLAMDTIVVTPETFPRLHNFIKRLCTAQKIATPVIFITREKSVLNAFAAKLFLSTGGILLTQRLIMTCSDEELEGIIAHEIGHIKYNHVNKRLCLTIGTLIGIDMIANKVAPESVSYVEAFAQGVYMAILASIVTDVIIGKKFEKQADAFAYKVTGHGPGMKKFFARLVTMQEHQDRAFEKTYTKIEESKEKIKKDDVQELKLRYYIAKGFHQLDRAFRWIYYHTPLGAHPSPEERIKTIDDYLKKEQEHVASV